MMTMTMIFRFIISLTGDHCNYLS